MDASWVCPGLGRLGRVCAMGCPDAAGCAGRGVAAASRRARWRLPSRRVGLISEGVSDAVLGDDRVFTYQCVAAQPGSPQDAPSWSGTT